MIDGILDRVRRLESEVLAIRTLISENTLLIGENTRITAETKQNTEDIIALYKGGILFSKIFMWLVVAGSAALSIWTWFRAKF